MKGLTFNYIESNREINFNGYAGTLVTINSASLHLFQCATGCKFLPIMKVFLVCLCITKNYMNI